MTQTSKPLTTVGRKLLQHLAEHGEVIGDVGPGGPVVLSKLRRDGYLTPTSTGYRAELTEQGRQAQ